MLQVCKRNNELSNCAIEPEIKDLINFLNEMGCNIKWKSKRTVKIVGSAKLKRFLIL